MMIPRIALVALALSGLAMPALAQQPSTPPSPANQAADVREQPVTEALNAGVQRKLETQTAITNEQQAQYDLDRVAYREAAKARVATIGQDTARAMRQEDAYARAMIVWRVQTNECKRGILKSCKKPTPLPADFY